jgi:polyhydroxybutyrate depolymerase
MSMSLDSQARRIAALTDLVGSRRMPQVRPELVFAALFALCLVACSSEPESTPAPAMNTSGSAATPSAPATAGTGTSSGTAGSTPPSTSSGTSGATSAGRGAQPGAGGAGSGVAGAPAAGTAAAGTTAAGTGATATAGTMGAAGMPAAGQGPAAGSSGPTTPQSCAGLTGNAGRTNETLENAGVTRRYILHVPSSYNGEKPVPLVLNFHPLLTDSATTESRSGWKAVADREGFIVAFPDGQESAAWNVGPCCTQSREVDDVGFAKALVKQVQSKFCVDAKRVYASGFSMGGGMAHYLGCEAADVFAAVAPGHFDLMEENMCTPARPITVHSTRSMSDVVVPYEGGRKDNAPNGFRGIHTFLGAVKTFQRWAELNGCTDQPMDTGGGCQTHKQCTAGVEVTLCTVGGGHVWPDAERAWQAISRFALP